MYRLWLEGGRGVWLYLAGLLTLTMRQTNIFWAAVFMGSLEVVRSLQTIRSVPGENEKNRSCWQGEVSATFHQYTRGEVHDVPLKDAEIYGMLSYKPPAYLPIRANTNRFWTYCNQHCNCHLLPPPLHAQKDISIYRSPFLLRSLCILEWRCSSRR